MTQLLDTPHPDTANPVAPLNRHPILLPVLACAACLVALFIACRNAPLGSPASDDYLILAHHRFGRFGWLDSDGLAWYWRPVSRQLYYLLLGPSLVNSPAIAATVHAGLLAITFGGLWSFARRFLPARGALVAAAFPLLVEPARTLLGWPSAAQHLLAMAGVSVALAAAASSRLWLTLVAAAVAMTSLETAVLVLPVLPLLPTGATRRTRSNWALAVGALGLAWLGVRFFVAMRGIVVPGIAIVLPRVGAALAFSLGAQLGVEDAAPAITLAALVCIAGILAACVWRPARPIVALNASRDRLLLAGGLLWWLVTSLPLAGVPDWNAWRSCLPGLGLGVAIAVLIARAGPWAAGSLLTLRVVLLLLAAPAPIRVSDTAPPSTSQLSFVRLVRLQRTLQATRRTLEAPPGLARGARVRYWGFPWLTEVGFGGAAAVRVWFDDPALGWEPFGGPAGFSDTNAVVVCFDTETPALAVRIQPAAQRELQAADAAVQAGNLAEGDRHLTRALALQREPVARLSAVVLGNRATLQLRLGAVARADSLHHAGAGLVPQSEWYRTEIAIALARADTARARAGIRDALQLGPPDRALLELSRKLAAN